VTLVFVLPVTAAVNGCVSPSNTVAFVGWIVTTTFPGPMEVPDVVPQLGSRNAQNEQNDANSKCGFVIRFE
jgi:hypothetical protein